MKAVFIERFGGPEVLSYGDQPDPVAGPGQVVVDVAAASVNGADWRVRAGQYGNAKFPLILGRDFSGTVSAAAADVSDLKVGDSVFGVLEAGREGAYAEKLAIAAADGAGKILRVVVDDFIGPEATNIVAIAGAGGGDHPSADMLGELDRKAGDAAGAALDEDRLAALQLERGLDGYDGG